MRRAAKTITVVLMVLCVLGLAQPKVLPGLAIDEFRAFADAFDPEIDNADRRALNVFLNIFEQCKTVEEMEIPPSLLFTIAFRKQDTEVKRYLIVILLKVYLCEVVYGDGIGLPINDGSIWTIFHPVSRSIHQMLRDMGIYGQVRSDTSFALLEKYPEFLQFQDVKNLATQICGIFHDRNLENYVNACLLLKRDDL